MMTPEFFMDIEKKTFSPYAQLTSASKGRERPEETSPVRTAYQRDRDRIIHSKSFRRLMHKTQVFLSPVDAKNLSERFWLLSKEVIEPPVKGNSIKGEKKETLVFSDKTLTNLKLYRQS